MAHRMDIRVGPIVRISPYELHVSDPAFFDVIFSRKGRWDKYDWTYNALGPQGATVFTVDHDDHRRRRAPLNPFFSKANVFRKREIIERNVQRLLSRVDHFAGHGDRVIDIGAGLSAFVRDVTDEFVCGTAGTNLDADDFNTKLSKLIAGSGVQWRVTKHVWWFGPLLHQLPMPVLKLLLGENLHIFREFLGNLQKIVHAIYASEPDPASPTIVHEILASDLPPADKVVSRVGPEIGTITAAGYETTATALRHIVYSTFSSPEVLRKVREEINSAKSKSGVEGELGLAELQQLPYLTAVLKEGLRLSPGVATRMARRTDHDLTYGDWCIPAGTPVGMTTLGLHLDEQSYPHATEFIPERWLGDEDGKKPRVYAPFSRGTRNCLGMQYVPDLFVSVKRPILCFAALISREPQEESLSETGR